MDATAKQREYHKILSVILHEFQELTARGGIKTVVMGKTLLSSASFSTASAILKAITPSTVTSRLVIELTSAHTTVKPLLTLMSLTL